MPDDTIARWQSETSADLLPDAVTNPAYLKKGKAKSAKTETKAEHIEVEADGQKDTPAEPPTEEELEEGKQPKDGDEEPVSE